MADMAAALVFLIMAGAVAVVAVRLGMLVAPRLERLIPADDEEPGDRPD